MDEVQTLNFLARRIHEWAIDKEFYDRCIGCNGFGYTNFDGTAFTSIEASSGELSTCAMCNGVGSTFDPLAGEALFFKQLMHICGEVVEIFDLTRLHSLGELVTYTGRPGIVPIEGYRVDNPCVPVVPDKHLPGHPAIAVELADILIRVLDMARWLRLDIGQALEDKRVFNNTRPQKHGKLH